MQTFEPGTDCNGVVVGTIPTMGFPQAHSNNILHFPKPMLTHEKGKNLWTSSDIAYGGNMEINFSPRRIQIKRAAN